MKKYISYLRVSTQRQGQSGLGLESQRAIIKNFVKDNEILQEFVEIETGTSKKKRVEVYKAISMCRETGATLIVAKLDRLARDVEFISAIQKMDMEIVFCDMPPANKLMIGILALLAEYEAKLISDRTKAALKSLKDRGKVLGNPKIHLYAKVANEAMNKNRTTENANTEATGFIIQKRSEGKSFIEIAKELNDQNKRTTLGKSFTADTVRIIFNQAKEKIAA